MVLSIIVVGAATSSGQGAEFPEAKGPAVVVRSNGFVLRGQLYSLSSSQVKLHNGRALVQLDASDVREVRVAGDTFTYSATLRTFQSANALAKEAQRRQAEAETRQRAIAAEQARQRALEAEAERRRILDAEAARSGRVRVVNNTSKEISFTITQYRDREGKDVVLDGNRSKPHWETFAEALSVLTNDNSAASRRSLNWRFDPRESAFVSVKDETLVTSKIHYTLTTDDGSQNRVMEKKGAGGDFVITVEKEHLHSPVLANVGRWRLEQDIWYTSHHARTAVRLDPVEIFGKTHYYVIGGEEYEYTREQRGGYATAWADVENPTDRTLEVRATVEFHFTHWLLSHDRVTAAITVPPRTKTKMCLLVNTRALIGNRKATSVSQVDITTTPK